MSDRIMAPDMTRPTGSSEAKIPEGELLSACIAARARPSTTRTPGPALTPSRILARAPRTLAFSDRPTSSAALALPTHHRVRPSRRTNGHVQSHKRLGTPRREQDAPRGQTLRADGRAHHGETRRRRSQTKEHPQTPGARASPDAHALHDPRVPPASLSDPIPLSRLTRPSPLPAKAHASYDPKTRVVKQLQSTVDNLLREQASHARLESTSRETFAHLAAEMERVRSAVATLADAVIEEMDAVRADHAAWRSEKEAWTSRVERVEATVEAKSAMIDAWGEARSAESAAATALRDEMRAATEAAAEARAALAAAEQREADIAERLRALRETAEGADAKLQEQIDAVRATAERAAAGPGDGSNAAVPIRDILLAGAASEADVVALRDWTKHVTEAHDGRLRRIERGLHLGGSAAGGGASSGGAGKPTPQSKPRSKRSSEGSV